PDTAFHCFYLPGIRVPIVVLKQSAFVKFLEDCRTRLERREGVLDSLFPLCMRQIAPKRDATAAPAERRESADFQKKIAIFLAELRSLAPVVNFQSRNNGVLREGSWIEKPGVRNHFL